jgi:hypothetical protein
MPKDLDSFKQLRESGIAASQVIHPNRGVG